MVVESLGVIACAGAGAGLLAHGARGRSSTLFGPSRWRGATGRPSIALTFDDGPSESTQDLLELLDRHHVRATFFQCGVPVRRLPSVARMVVSAGHEVGNHSDTHASFYRLSAAGIYEELAAAQAAILEASGVAPKLFRAPYGVRWFGLRAAQKRLGLTGVMWTAIGRDWKLPAAGVVARLSAAATPGAIFCLHDGRDLKPDPDISATLEAVARLIPQLKDRGYHFETVSEILCPTNLPRES
jgi:peptidoglycan-N-acetylglucosamine deacetylase